MSNEPQGAGAFNVARAGDAWRFTWGEVGVQMEFDRLTDHREGLYAEILVAAVADGSKPRLLHASRLNLHSPTSMNTVAKALAARAVSADWAGMLQAAAYWCIQRHREGEPTVDLRTVDPYERPRWVLKPYWEHGGPTVLFGAGGHGKSFLAAAMAVTVASGQPLVGHLAVPAGPVLYLDWETDQYTHAERVEALCNGARLPDRPPIYYRRVIAPLADSVPTLRREVDRLGAIAVVVDSLGYACGGELEDAATILRTFAAVRALARPALVVSHVTKAIVRGEGIGVGRLSPFGSTYTENSARNTWSIQRASEEGADEQVTLLVHEKTNNGRYQKRHALRWTFTNDTDAEGDEHLIALELAACDAAQLAEFAERVPLRDRIFAQFDRGALRTSEEVAEALGLPLKQIAPRLSEMKRKGELVYLDSRRYGRAAVPNMGPASVSSAATRPLATVAN